MAADQDINVLAVMRAESSSFDHPPFIVAATVAVAILMLAVTLGVEDAAAELDAGALLTLWVFVCGGLLFALYAPAAARWSRAVLPHDASLLLVFGLTFAGWGLITGWMLGGAVAAIISTVVLACIVRDWRVAIAPLLALAPAWAITFRLSDGPGAVPMSQTVWMLSPVLIWNVEMSIVFAAWSAWRRRNPRPVRQADPRRCPACRYDLTGLREPICPECGADVCLSAPHRT